MRLSRRARRTGAARSARERGAAAVEFALILTLLVPMLLGIVDYGLWFSDTLSVRHGVHEAARLGVVQRPTCTTGTNDLARIACTARQQTGASGGPAYALVKAPQGWARGKPLVVCVVVQENAVTGVTPLPSGRLISSKATLAIEVDTPVPSGASATASSSAHDPAPPAGVDWSWCS